MNKPSVELTALEKDDLCGGHWEDRYPIPSESAFDAKGIGRLDSDDLAAMAQRLIAFDRLKIGHLARFRLRVMWMKTGGSSGSKPRWGSVAIASPDDKLFTGEDGAPIDAKVRLAADNLREAEETYWGVANQLCFQLKRIGIYTTQEGGVERLVLIAPDASFFTEQMEVFGPQTPELKRTIFDIRQARFEWADRLADDIAKAEAAKEHDPSVDQAPGVADELGPVEGGAPEPEWAESIELKACSFCGETTAIDWGNMAATCGQCGKALFPVDDPTDDTHDPETGEERGWIDAGYHRDLIVDKFGTKYVDSLNGVPIEVCRRCGVAVELHDPEVCEGGTPAQQSSRRKAKPSAAVQEIKNAIAFADGPYDASSLPHANGNGAHAPDDFDTPNRDPALVVRALTEAGRQIVFEQGQYRHPSGLPVYSTAWVEGELRGLTAKQ